MTEPWTPDLSRSNSSRYKAIAEAIGQDIDNDILKPGMRLPAQRQLAYRLNVTLGTVTRGYDEAKRLGLIGGEVGRGTYVLGKDGAASANDSYNPAPDQPAPEIDLALNRNASTWNQGILNRTLSEMAGSGDLTRFLDYQPDKPFKQHAEAGSKLIAKTGLEAPSSRIVISNGAQHGTLISLMALTRPGDRLAVEELSYPMIKNLARHLGLKLIPVKMDDRGLLPEDLDKVCALHKPQALYCMPTLHNPTTAIMDEARRENIATLCKRHELYVIEDDILGLLPDNTPKPLTRHLPELGFYITSISKVMAAGLRIGYVLAPAHKLQALRTAMRTTGWMISPIMAEIAGRWISSETGDKLIRHHRKEAAQRHSILTATLAGYRFHAHPASYHVWLELPDPWREQSFKSEAAKKGVAIINGDNFAMAQTPTPQAVRICLGRPEKQSTLKRGLTVLARLLESGPDTDPGLF